MRGLCARLSVLWNPHCITLRSYDQHLGSVKKYRVCQTCWCAQSSGSLNDPCLDTQVCLSGLAPFPTWFGLRRRNGHWRGMMFIFQIFLMITHLLIRKKTIWDKVTSIFSCSFICESTGCFILKILKNVMLNKSLPSSKLILFFDKIWTIRCSLLQWKVDI